MAESDREAVSLRITRRQVTMIGAGIFGLLGAYVTTGLWLDSNFDDNRAQYIAEAEQTRAQVVAQDDWIRSELLSIVAACTVNQNR